MNDQDELERLAAEELICEAKRGSLRASVAGPSGWKKCPLSKTNTKFLRNTIIHTLNSNSLKKKSQNHKKIFESSNGGTCYKGNKSVQDSSEKNNLSECPLSYKKKCDSLKSKKPPSESSKVDKQTSNNKPHSKPVTSTRKKYS